MKNDEYVKKHAGSLEWMHEGKRAALREEFTTLGAHGGGDDGREMWFVFSLMTLGVGEPLFGTIAMSEVLFSVNHSAVWYDADGRAVDWMIDCY